MEGELQIVRAITHVKTFIQSVMLIVDLCKMFQKNCLLWKCGKYHNTRILLYLYNNHSNPNVRRSDDKSIKTSRKLCVMLALEVGILMTRIFIFQLRQKGQEFYRKEFLLAANRASWRRREDFGFVLTLRKASAWPD